jgi:hypothetical protein
VELSGENPIADSSQLLSLVPPVVHVSIWHAATCINRVVQENIINKGEKGYV